MQTNLEASLKPAPKTENKIPKLCHGVLLIDKPESMTSHDVVAKVRWILKTKQVGHAGTLDPLATGLLVLLIGEGTKLSDYLLNADKAYEVLVQLGLETDSLDITGEVQSQKTVDLTKDKIIKACKKLTGPLQLPVPNFSAVKVKGKKLYEAARNGQEIKAPVKEMTFDSVNVTEVFSDKVRAEISCKKGAFIRSWAKALGEELEVGGCVAELRRTVSSPFNVQQSLSLDALQKFIQEGGELSQHDSFRGIEEALPKMKTVTVKGRDETLMRNGQVPIDLQRRLINELKAAIQYGQSQPIRVFGAKNMKMLAIIEARAQKGFKIKRVFNHG